MQKFIVSPHILEPASESEKGKLQHHLHCLFPKPIYIISMSFQIPVQQKKVSGNCLLRTSATTTEITSHDPKSQATSIKALVTFYTGQENYKFLQISSKISFHTSPKANKKNSFAIFIHRYPLTKIEMFTWQTLPC